MPLHRKPTPFTNIFRSFYNINTKICAIRNVCGIRQPKKNGVQVNFSNHNIPTADIRFWLHNARTHSFLWCRQHKLLSLHLFLSPVLTISHAKTKKKKKQIISPLTTHYTTRNMVRAHITHKHTWNDMLYGIPSYYRCFRNTFITSSTHTHTHRTTHSAIVKL